MTATCLAQLLMILIASMLVSGYQELQANSARHFTASWNELMMAAKCCSNMAARWMRRRRRRR